MPSNIATYHAPTYKLLQQFPELQENADFLEKRCNQMVTLAELLLQIHYKRTIQAVVFMQAHGHANFKLLDYLADYILDYKSKLNIRTPTIDQLIKADIDIFENLEPLKNALKAELYQYQFQVFFSKIVLLYFKLKTLDFSLDDAKSLDEYISGNIDQPLLYGIHQKLREDILKN